MTADQIVLSVILVGVLGLLLWGRIRYDLIAFAALIIAVVSGVVKTEDRLRIACTSYPLSSRSSAR